MPAIGLGVKLAGKILSADQAERLLANYANGVSGSFSDNSLVIRDSVTPANDYNGELITADVFNKFTYSRASLATMVGSDGLVKYANHNLIKQSQGDTEFLSAGTTPPVTTDSVSFLGESNTSVQFTAAMTDVGYAGCRSARLGGDATLAVGMNYNLKINITLSRALVGAEEIILYWTGANASDTLSINSANSAGYVGAFVRASVDLPCLNAGTIYPVVYLGSAVGSNLTVYVNKAQVQAKPVHSTGYLATGANPVHSPRIHYNPSTLAKLGYLHEGARTNSFLRSEEFDNASWTKTGLLAFGAGSTVNATAAPDGANTAELITEDTTANPHRVYQTVTIAAGTYTVSWDVKPNGRTWVYLYADAGLQTAYVDVVNQVVGTVFGTPTIAFMSLANGFTRVSMTYVNTTTVGQNIQLWLATGNNASAYTGDGVSGAYIWGAQLELGGAASSYIPTTTAAVTRAADRLKLLSSLFNLTQAAGTLYVKNTYIGGSAVFAANRRSICVGNGGGARNDISNIAAAVGGFTHNGVAEQAALVGAAVTDGVFTKCAFAFAAADFSFVQDGAAAVTQASGTLPTTTGLFIGQTDFDAAELEGTIQEFAFIGERVSNVAMQALTS